ncbi:ribose ABC transporter permease [Romboutsia weinsteinii]|uniref:ribose ABC transporter permease n=1 Tax=Romboutsia weinsteinii TaxID=2020949 RepID=UPI0026B7CD33|nr:ribose ABC transporter permease [Romboutsia weinsteinii]
MDISSRVDNSKNKSLNMKEVLVKYKSLLGLVLLIAVVSVLNPSFLSVKNIMNILRQTSVNAVIAAGMTFVILTGGIDLSVGSILGISGAVCASLLVSGQNVVVAVIAALLVGAAVGFINGFVISKGKLQPFIATLATMTILKGLTLVYTNGNPITLGSNELAMSFGKIGGGTIFGIPTPAMIMMIVFMVCYYILHNTKMGRYTYALGSNEEATKLSGLNTDKIKIWVYTISGILASVAGIIITSRLYSAQPTAGAGYELDAIAAVVLGGTKLAGGKGKITGTIIGALIIGVLSNALNILDVSSYYQTMVKGGVILLAVLLDRKSN